MDDFGERVVTCHVAIKDYRKEKLRSFWPRLFRIGPVARLSRKRGDGGGGGGGVAQDVHTCPFASWRAQYARTSYAWVGAWDGEREEPLTRAIILGQTRLKLRAANSDVSWHSLTAEEESRQTSDREGRDGS